MRIATTWDLAEGAFYLREGLLLSSVEVRRRTEGTNALVYMIFRGENARRIMEAWRKETGDAVIPIDVARLLVALGKKGEAFL